MEDVLGQAIADYYHQTEPKKLWVNNKYWAREQMPVHVYFRDDKGMSTLERMALKKCYGKILDIGAGAGSHVLWLQHNNQDVTALEISPLACNIMQLRGVQHIIQKDIFAYADATYDTLLLLMNGIGLVGNLTGLQRFLQHAKTLLQPGGQLLFDSSDVSYLYDGSVGLSSNYFGEIDYQYQYKKIKTNWFTWLYIDQATLQQIAFAEGWKTEFLMADEFAQYLVRLTILQNV
ncbi:MAG: class I SAM-dependent methyltransferase [Deinococcales bacterium]|nr:class I SAM-dependent methyltransferase [Chitinophagaceae bacterium]